MEYPLINIDGLFMVLQKLSVFTSFINKPFIFFINSYRVTIN